MIQLYYLLIHYVVYSIYIIMLPCPSHSAQVHVTLTSDQNKIFKALQPLEPKGSVNFVTSLRIAHVSIIQTTVHLGMHMCMHCLVLHNVCVLCGSVGSEAPTEQEPEDEGCGIHRQSSNCL